MRRHFGISLRAKCLLTDVNMLPGICGRQISSNAQQAKDCNMTCAGTSTSIEEASCGGSNSTLVYELDGADDPDPSPYPFQFATTTTALESPPISGIPGAASSSVNHDSKATSQASPPLSSGKSRSETCLNFASDSGAIAGAVIGGVLGTALILFAAYLAVRSRRDNTPKDSSVSPAEVLASGETPARLSTSVRSARASVSRTPRASLDTILEQRSKEEGQIDDSTS